MSPKAVTTRLIRTSQLRRLCLALRSRRSTLRVSAPVFLLLLSCTPRVAVEAPKEPITINMNIKIEHQIKVQVDKDLEQAFANQEDIF
jgi:hypothetical protein